MIWYEFLLSTRNFTDLGLIEFPKALQPLRMKELKLNLSE